VATALPRRVLETPPLPGFSASLTEVLAAELRFHLLQVLAQRILFASPGKNRGHPPFGKKLDIHLVRAS